MIDDAMMVVVNGQQVSIASVMQNLLFRAVLLSLFTWRRANTADVLPGEDKLGWCGDSLATVVGDQWGSRLWLLRRAKLVTLTYRNAEAYATEALQWMIDDGVAARIVVQASRLGKDGMGMIVTIYRSDGTPLLDLRFSDVWSMINV